jgi:hypothetical protein
VTAGASLVFTPAQLARLRAALGFRPGDRELTAGDVVAALEADAIVAAESRRWHGRRAALACCGGFRDAPRLPAGGSSC